MMNLMPKLMTKKLHTAQRSAPVLRQRWVETADERCPLACTWMAIDAVDAPAADEPDSSWPAPLPGEQAYLRQIQAAA